MSSKRKAEDEEGEGEAVEVDEVGEPAVAQKVGPLLITLRSLLALGPLISAIVCAQQAAAVLSSSI